MAISVHRLVPTGLARSPRIIMHPPGPGYWHPAGRADVRRFLQQLPPRFRYKLRSIELRRAPPPVTGGAPPLGRLLLPGRVILYAQPRSSWLLGGFLADAEHARLLRAGARVTVDRRSSVTVVMWPPRCLRDFMLHEVLLHELAHHLLQVRRAKLIAPVVRTVDHEATAHGLGRRQAIRLAGHAWEHA